MPAPLKITIVDDDESVRESLPPLLETMGLEARAFACAEDFLASDALAGTDCLVLDITMPGMSGPELQRELQRRGCGMPIVFITARKDEALCRRLREEGAAACLYKPFGDAALLQALKEATSRA